MISWSDVILILYSVTDLGSYHTANIAHKYITSRHQFRKVLSIVAGLTSSVIGHCRIVTLTPASSWWATRMTCGRTGRWPLTGPVR